jgi:hypothetical protein
MPVPHVRLVAALVAVLLSVALIAAGPASAVAAPATPTGLPLAIEPLASYVEQSSCDPTVKPGTSRFAHLLAATYPGTTWASAYACGTDGNRSEHYEGRAIDWMVSIRNATQKADASAVIAWLLAADKQGNHFAMARRLGVQYLIYNNRIWGSWNGAWAAYQDCATRPSIADDNYCHRTHMHISLSWNGAMGTTSFWAKKVPTFDYGPCRPSDLNWAARRLSTRTTQCPHYASVQPSAGASTMKINLVKYSGAGVHLGMTGPIVVAVQQGVRVPATGTYDLATQIAVLGIQIRHLLRQTGSMTQETWRTLLAARR